MSKGWPNKIKMANGEVLKLVILRVQCKYEDGTPEDVTIIKDDMMVEITEGAEFITAYVLERVVTPT